ncbi:MAG: hypothetical protein DRN26_00615 [Thermoplasmata archaeon]|nr:MAG: hypothetical protein DRN26_00615 [Thermoplasmata archaeon]
MPGHPRFYILLQEIKELHNKKNADYSEEGNPLSNFYECEKFGIPAWKGCLVRISDKTSRIFRLAAKGKAEVKEESIIDTLKDLAVYSLICIILYEQACGENVEASS